MKGSQLTRSQTGKNLSSEEVQRALNDWMDKIEQQVNSIEEIVYKNITTKTEEGKKSDLYHQINSAKQIAIGAEQLANRLTDDALAGQEELRRQIQEMDFKINEIFSFMGESEEGRSQNNGIKSSQRTPSKMMHQSLSRMQSIEQQLLDFEKRVNSRMADSVESLGQIITEYANKYNRLNERVAVIETGKPRLKRNVNSNNNTQSTFNKPISAKPSRPTSNRSLGIKQQAPQRIADDKYNWPLKKDENFARNSFEDLLVNHEPLQPELKASDLGSNTNRIRGSKSREDSPSPRSAFK